MAVEITEVRIKLMEESGERLQAFCSITFDDCFVIRDLKIIEGANGPFVAMPSRKLTAHCPQCGCKNHLKAAFCNQCGLRLKEDRAVKDEDGRTKLYADIAHPINSGCREMIQDRVIREFHAELERAKLPGYVSRYDDFDHEETFAQPHRGAKPYRRDGHADRTGDRVGRAVYQKPGSEPASQIQPPEQQPRAPHKTAPAQPVAAAAPAIPSTVSPTPGIPPIATAAGPAIVARTSAEKSDGFGAGIF
jgi:stage V sporulation protein G